MEAHTLIIIEPPASPYNREVEMKRAYKKQWRMNHKEEIKIYQRAYMKNNNNLTTCNICGGEFKQYGRGLHEQTTKHTSKMRVMEMEETIRILVDKLTHTNIPV